MKLKFKHQAYQAEAVQAVVDCFKGQLPNDAAAITRLIRARWLQVTPAPPPMKRLGLKTPRSSCLRHNCWPISRQSKPGRICPSPAHSMITAIGMAKINQVPSWCQAQPGYRDGDRYG